MKIVIDIDEKDYKRYKDYPMCYPEGIFKIVGNGTPLEEILEEIPNPCIECSQNCCVSDLNGEKCSCQKIYVLKENR